MPDRIAWNHRLAADVQSVMRSLLGFRSAVVAVVASVGLVAAGCASSTGSPPPQPAAVYGHVTAGPTCPVERADQPCPPRPVVAHIDARDGAGHNVAATNSDRDGRYSLTLAPGTYTLVAATGATYPRCAPTAVTVTDGVQTRADINCDTGIR